MRAAAGAAFWLLFTVAMFGAWLLLTGCSSTSSEECWDCRCAWTCEGSSRLWTEEYCVEGLEHHEVMTGALEDALEDMDATCPGDHALGECYCYPEGEWP